MWSSGEAAGRRALTRLVLAALGAALATLLLAQPASAHAVLVGSDPADGAALDSAPSAVHLQFNEDISPDFRSAQLIDGAGRPVAGARLAAAAGDRRQLTLDLPRIPAGAYGVLWQVLAETDGHTTSGVVVFSVGAAAPAPGLKGAARAPSAARPLDVARRWLGISLLAGLIGGLAFAGPVLGRAGDGGEPGSLPIAVRAARRRLLLLVAGCAGLAAAVGVADLVAEAYRLAGAAPGHGFGISTLARLLGDTRWGHLWLVREPVLLALMLVSLGLALRLRAVAAAPGRPGGPRPGSIRAAASVLALLVAVLVTVEALGSHAASAASGRTLSVAAASVHVLAACLWLGALPALAVTLWPRGGTAAGRSTLIRACRGRFSRLALGSALAVTVTGLFAAGRQVDDVAGLTGTAYGRTLLVKSALVVVLMVLGLLNASRVHGWRRLPRLGPAPGEPGEPGERRPWFGPPAASRRLVLVEAAVGLMVLLAVGMLLETVPARGTAARATGPSAPASAPATQAPSSSGSLDDLVVSVSASPNRPGVNGFTVRAQSTRRPPPAPIQSVRLELDQAGDATSVSLREISPGRYFGTGLFDPANSLRLAPVRLSVLVQRAGRWVAVPVAWSLSQPPSPERPSPVTPVAQRRLAPYTDAGALGLLGVALAAAAAWAAARGSRRRTPTGVASPAGAGAPPPAEDLPEDVSGAAEDAAGETSQPALEAVR